MLFVIYILGIKDVEKYTPGKIKQIHDWFRYSLLLFYFFRIIFVNKYILNSRDYKIPEGKPQNKFAFNGVPIDKVQF